MLTENTPLRIAFLDGLRGVAILLVAFYHAFARWPDIVPYGNSLASFLIFQYGWLGVQLFFLISGFVIFMTLERCTSFPVFILRRWLRLFPAMLICSTIIYLTAPLFPERPLGQPSFYDLIPGLTFIDPDWWSKLFGLEFRSIDGAFWSLYIEVKFYIVFGLLYFSIGWRKAILALFTLFCLTVATALTRKVAPGLELRLLGKILAACGAEHWGWFAAGALYYKYYREKRPFLLIYAITAAVISALALSGFKSEQQLPTLLICLIFTLSIVNKRAQSLLTHPCLLFIGFISYPLYLIHQNMMIALIVKLGHNLPSMLPSLMPVIPIALVMTISWIVAAYLEPWTREKLKLPYTRFNVLSSKIARSSGLK